MILNLASREVPHQFDTRYKKTNRRRKLALMGTNTSMFHLPPNSDTSI